MGFGKDVPDKNESSEIYVHVLLFSIYISLELNRRCPCGLEETEFICTAS